MAAKEKDTIYIDIDDEITGIIDKLKASEGQVVALVLPKRAAVFQSIVNMKLLKRAADSANKNVVLITTEAGLLPLAGAAAVHVAKTLTSKPEIPLGPQAIDDTEESVEEPAEPAEPTVGQLAGNTPPPPPADGGVETLMLDDEELAPEETAAAAAAGAAAKKPAKAAAKKDKKLHIPNFNRFRLLLIVGGLIILLLIAGLIFATVALPKATINIKTDATNVDANLNLNLSTTAKSLDPSSGTIPAKLASQQKTYTQQVPTTGQKNNGNKASGSITMTAQICTVPKTGPPDVPSGAGVSSNGLTYITQEATSFNQGGTPDGNGCLNFSATGSTTIQAQSGGANYNGASTFKVSSSSGFTVTASVASAIAGGTDNIVQSVNQNDINGAKAKISTSDSTIKQALDSQLKGENQYPLEATYVAGTPVVTTSANVGDVATSVTVTETVTYTMFGVSKDDLNTLIDNQVNGQIDTSKQSILDTGLAQGVFNVNTISSTGAQLSLSTKAIAGPALNVDTIKQQAAGKRIGEIKGQLSNNPDVTSVDVNLSPFWITTAPKKTSRIIVNIAKPTTTKASNSSGNSP
ncbi:MAG TPA: hypothetical protein VMU97_02065 [Candidatus Dormibacteraeota bacterium]|nr:hypothetical protein [Candidatus Dormibacteraeota bacterium]